MICAGTLGEGKPLQSQIEPIITHPAICSKSAAYILLKVVTTNSPERAAVRLREADPPAIVKQDIRELWHFLPAIVGVDD